MVLIVRLVSTSHCPPTLIFKHYFKYYIHLFPLHPHQQPLGTSNSYETSTTAIGVNHKKNKVPFGFTLK